MKGVLSCIVLLSWTCAQAFAETSYQALTWQECVQLAAKNNPELLASLLSMQSSRADYRKSYNGIFPQIDLTNTYREGEAGGSISPTIWSANASVSLNLIDPGEWASIQLALATYKGSQASYHVSASNTLLNLYQAFSGLLYAQDAIRVNRDILDIWKTNAQMIQLRYQSGRESKGNTLNTQAQLLQAESTLEQSYRNLMTAQAKLRQALGNEAFTVKAVTGTWTAPAQPEAQPDFESLMKTLPTIQVQEAAVEQARARIRSAQSTIWPSLGLNYNRGATGPTEFPQNPFWTFTGTLSVPIFSGGPTSTYYANQSAQRSFDKSQQDLRNTRFQARTDLETSWSSLMEAEDQVRVQRAFLVAALQRKEESDIRYQSGLMSFEDWNRVVTDYVSFETSFLRAQQNRVLAEAQWRFSKGESI